MNTSQEKTTKIPSFYPEISGKLVKIENPRKRNPFKRKSFCESLEEMFGLKVLWYEYSVVVFKDAKDGYQEYYSNHEDQETARSCATMKMVASLSKH